jgi:hypothetical protein
MPNEINPLTKIYLAIWELLNASPEFAEAVRVGNQVSYMREDNRDPLKQSVATADLPEVALVQNGIDCNLFNTSSGTKFVVEYALIINTGDFRLGETTSLLNWVAVCQFAKWKDYLAALTWKGKTFLKVCRLLNAKTGQSDPNRNRQINGFTTVWVISCECHITTSDLSVTE